MKTTFLNKLALACWLILASLAVHAEDIDIYSSAAGSGPRPNIIIILDTDASNDASYNNNCSFAAIGSTTQGFDATRCALYTALDTIKNTPALKGKLNIGMMGFGQGSSKIGLWLNPGPYPSDLPLMDDNGILAMQSAVVSDTLATVKSGGAFSASAFQESWAFYTGNTGLSGHSYADHINLACQKSFIIYIGSVSTNSSKPSSGVDSGYAAINDAITATNKYTGSTIPQLTSSDYINTGGNPNFGPNTKYDSASWMDEWARFLYRTDFSNLTDRQNIVTYTISANFGGTQFNADYDQTLTSAAYYGGGKKFVVTDAQSMVNALLKIFNEVQAVNSVFSSASLPVSASAQGTYLNQVFMGSFRPDVSGAPRWMGNLKQYQFGVDTTDLKNPTLFLGDASWGPYPANTSANLALSSSGTGFISANAISYWSGTNTNTAPDAPPSVLNGTNGFWVNNPQSAGGAFDSPDGEVVEKGGAGQQIRLANLTDNYATNPTGPRNVYTCLGSSCAANSLLSLMPFATTNSDITASILGTNGAAMGVKSIARSSSTATVTLSSAPSPALAAGQSVTIAGSQYREFNGTFSITPLTTTTFSYPITIDPPTPSAGTYTASVPSNPIAITLTRSSTTVTGTSTAAHGFATGQTVTIAGATGSRYNGSFVVTSTGTNTFTYTITDGPASPDGGGTAKVGSTSYAIPSGSIVRSTSGSNNVSNVTVTFGSAITFNAGNTVTISGAGTGGISTYNGTWVITNTGTSCAGGAKSGKQPLSFCFNINSTPASPDPATAITADGGTKPLAITNLSYTVGACSAPAYSTVLVTASTSSAPTFAAGGTVSVGGTVAANESAYVGSFKIVSVSTSAPYNFTYNIPTSPGTASTCTDSTSGITASAQGVSRDSLINWVRGDDNIGDEPSPGNGITIRPSVHGDVLHSRPAVINYGGSTGVVVFYGANDGMFRAVNGNQPPATNVAPAPKGSCTTSATCAIGGTPPGGELWSFVAPEFYSKLQRLYNNNPVLKLATTPTGITPTPQPKDYFFDGTPGIYQNTATGKAYIFLSARRGGPLLYALDVSNPTAPKFMWRHTNADPGFTELGQTWSQPKVALIKGNANPVLIFGAGYDDKNEDLQPPSADTMGRGIFIVDAVTGAMLWQASPNTTCSSGVTCVQVPGMTYAIPADITLVDRNFDGYIDRLYAADVGGNIWRVDLEPVTGSTSLSNAQVTLLAALGGTGTTKRKMFFPPDVVLTNQYDAVSASTGDREHPLSIQQPDKTFTFNRFYMIKDKKVGMSATGWTPVLDPATSPMLFDATSTAYDGSLNGFYINLGTGENGVNAPTTVAGVVYFGTNQPTAPSTTSCVGNLGTARSYGVNFITGQSTSTVFDGGGLSPSPVFGIVTVNVNGQPRQIPFMIGSGTGSTTDSKSSLGATKPVIPVKSTRKRTYWYRNIDH